MKPKRRQKIIVLILLLASLLSLNSIAVEAVSSDTIQEQIDGLEEKQSALQAEIDGLEQQKADVLSSVQSISEEKSRIEQQVFLIYEQIENTNVQIENYSEMIAYKQQELEQTQKKYDELYVLCRKRIRAMEENGNITYLEFLFKADSISDFLSRIDAVREIMAYDARQLNNLNEAAEAVSAAANALEEEKSALEDTKKSLEESQMLLKEKEEDAAALLQELTTQGNEYQALIDASENKQEQLLQEIAQKEKEYADAAYQEWLASYVPPTPAPSSGTSPDVPGNAPSSQWMTPVPYYTLTSPFGWRIHPITQVEKFHSGLDMACASGTEIYATRSGTVTNASYNDSAGYNVSISHGDGYTSIYMHMTRYVVSDGDTVTAGQVIGYVGSTGMSTGPHLHFTVKYNGEYVDPQTLIG
ncbi:MAG: peptidoglycan DD-metalloendopeptidase family protein [Clostridiaceae bacterium]|nr:peptidoglycan DD-metalloendopeptidase family protein [Clostridiaceae bacterium]